MDKIRLMALGTFQTKCIGYLPSSLKVADVPDFFEFSPSIASLELSFVLKLVTELTSKVVQLPTTAAHPVNYQPMKGPPSASLSHRPLVHMDAESAVAHSRCIRPGGFFHREFVA